jgi:peroxiredoxin
MQGGAMVLSSPIHAKVPFRAVALLAMLAFLVPVSAIAVGVGDSAPSFSLTDLNGDRHSLMGYQSHPVLLMFLESDASVSINQAPLVQNNIYESFRDDDVQVLGLECRNADRSELENFRDQTGVEFPLLRDAASVQNDYGVPIGSFVLIDGFGVVRYVSLGPDFSAYDPSGIRTAINQVLQEAANTAVKTWGLIKALYN